MIAVLDLNVVLDSLLGHEDALECNEILSLARTGSIDAIIPMHGIATIYYVSRKALGDSAAREELRLLLKMVRVVALDSESLRALNSPMKDFEDSIVAETAVISGADCIVTRNLKDFIHSPVPAIRAPMFLTEFFSK